MPIITRSSGIRVTLPENIRLTGEGQSSSQRATSGPVPAFIPMPAAVPASNEAARVAAALEEQDMVVVDTLPLESVPLAPGVTGRAVTEPAEIAVDMTLGADEEAVVLLEQDGLYAWQFEATKSEVAAQPSGVRHVRGAPSPTRHVTFRIKLHPPETTRAAGLERRGFLTDFIVGRAQAIIFKFAGRFLLKEGAAYLEGHVKQGIVVMDGDNPVGWHTVPDFAAVNLPADRPSRILLFVHGTFSSTKGGFGALGATAWGQSFLSAARANYNAVLGFDHPTLSVDPRVNAKELLRLLKVRSWSHTARIDVICHSRGAITIRSLTEYLLPAVSASLPIKIERIVFVGGTNAGTKLAQTDNLRSLIDLYTNLAVGACRAIELFPAATFAAALLGELLKSVGTLAKTLVKEGITNASIPGLAAMEPTGPFITELNQTQPGQPIPAECNYYAITSEFKAKLALNSLTELPKTLLHALADGLVDQIMHAANDLVVDTPSMTSIDPQAGAFIKDILSFGANGTVYHTNYFLQPQVTNALARWLDLIIPEAASPARPRGLVKLGTTVGPTPPACVDVDTMVLHATDLARDATIAIDQTFPSYVVVERPWQGKRLHYGFTAEEVLHAAIAMPDAPLIDALNLHESDASVEAYAGTFSFPSTTEFGRPSYKRIVLMDAGDVIGVAEPTVKAASLANLVKTQIRLAKPEDSSEFRILARRTLPTLNCPYQSQKKYVGTLPAFETNPPPDTTRKTRKIKSDADAEFKLATIDINQDILVGQDSIKASPTQNIEAKSSPSPTTPSSAPTPTPAPTPVVLCHFLAEMDDQVQLNVPTSVFVTLSREMIQAVHAAAQRGEAPIQPDRKLIVDLIPKKNFRSEGVTRVDVDVPQPGEPAIVTFDASGTDVGDGEVWIQIRQGVRPFVILKLHSIIVARLSQPAVRRSETASVIDVATPPSTFHELKIFENERGGKMFYHYILESIALDWKNSYESEPLIGSRETYVNHIYADIEKRWLSNKLDYDQFEIELKELGAGLWDELFPPELQKAIWEKRDRIDCILVLSEEPFIPWELVFLKEPGKNLDPNSKFLGEMGLVRWQHNNGWPVETLHARPGRCHYVIPRYPHPAYELKEAKQEAAFLEQQFHATSVSPHAGPVHDILTGPGAFDLLHFACHGYADLADIARAEVLLEGRLEKDGYVTERFRATTVEQSANLIAPDGKHSIVVLNACRVGLAGYKLTTIGGFARAFIKQGAGIFIGALWSIGDQPARIFTEKLYTRLLEGDNLATASIAARKEARTAREGTWLAYAVYGNPHAVLTKSTPIPI